MIGRLLGKRYEVLELIGGGGMALVYRAKDIYLYRTVAVKVLREQFSSDEDFLTRFRHEAQAVASLSHVNIVNIYDVGWEEDIHYLVMELVEGKNLKKLIKERGTFSLEETASIIGQICDALEHAHEHQIIHRDIKPHNIIITDSGRAKVTDFGIARAVSTATVIHTGSVLGSVHYFSPEQARGHIADERSDIYSLGVVIYEMLTGKLPFDGESTISVAMKKLHEDPVSPRKLNPDISEAMEKVILKAINQKPEARYQSVKALKEDLFSVTLDGSFKTLPEEEPAVESKTSEDTVMLPVADGKRKKKKIRARMSLQGKIIISAIVIVGFLAGIYLSSMALMYNKVTVPNVVGKTVEEADKELAALGLDIVKEKEIHHPSARAGSVITQEPESEEIVKKGSEVKVSVSSGPKYVKMPNVTRHLLIFAKAVLDEEGLELGEISRAYHSQIKAGYVIHQEPDAEREVVQGSQVKLIISKGPEPAWVRIPNLVGQTADQAKAAIQDLELTMGVVQEEGSMEYPAGYVIRQDPQPESEMLAGSTVNFVVSTGPGPVSRPIPVKVMMPQSGKLKIIVDDVSGRYVDYESYHYNGESVERYIRYAGSGMIEVYIDNQLIEEFPIE